MVRGRGVMVRGEGGDGGWGGEGGKGVMVVRGGGYGRG